jgi:hypothetical protein
MLLSIPCSSYNKQFLIFHSPVKNIMMEHSSFIRLYYSTHNIIFNGLFLNHPSLDDVLHIEKDILDAYRSKKTPVYTIQKQYKHKHLKISGLWENDTSFGIVFKFIWIHSRKHFLQSRTISQTRPR